MALAFQKQEKQRKVCPLGALLPVACSHEDGVKFQIDTNDAKIGSYLQAHQAAQLREVHPDLTDAEAEVAINLCNGRYTEPACTASKQSALGFSFCEAWILWWPLRRSLA